jgi:hypothetical protein
MLLDLCWICTWFFSLHNNGHPANCYSMFGGRRYAPLSKINNIAYNFLPILYRIKITILSFDSITPKLTL